MNKSSAGCLAAILCVVITGHCFARETLFYKISRTYDQPGLQGRIFQREFEARMFPRSRWHERLFISPYEPAIDETLETYSKPDGSRWLSHRRAAPSLSRIIEPAPSGEQYDIKKELEAVRVTSQEVALPAEVAKEIGLLWRTMLPGLPSEPKNKSTMRVLYIHPPAFIAFERENQSVETGRIVTAAIETPTFRAFADIVDDLIKVCEGGGVATNSIFEQLPRKIRRLRERL